MGWRVGESVKVEHRVKAARRISNNAGGQWSWKAEVEGSL